MKVYRFLNPCGAGAHHHIVEIFEEDDEVIVEFLDHEDIGAEEKKLSLIDSMTRKHRYYRPADCFDIFQELVGKEGGRGLSILIETILINNYRGLKEADEDDYEKVRLLLEAGADPNYADPIGHSLLRSAIVGGASDIARLLIAAGADVSRGNFDGVSPLHAAAGIVVSTGGYEWLGDEKRKELTRILLDAGAPVDEANDLGWTALHYAARFGFPGVAEVLIRAGANPYKKSSIGQTPTELTVVYGQWGTGRRIRQLRDELDL